MDRTSLNFLFLFLDRIHRIPDIWIVLEDTNCPQNLKHIQNLNEIRSTNTSLTFATRIVPIGTIFTYIKYLTVAISIIITLQRKT